MKKMIIILFALSLTITSYNQTSRQASDRDNTSKKEETKKNSNSSPTRSNSQHERSTPASSNHSSNNQSTTTDRTNSSSHSNNSNSNHEQGRDQDSHHNNNTQSKTPAVTSPERNDRGDSYDRNHTAGTTTRPVNESRTYVRHPENRDYESPRVDRERHEPYHHYDRPPEDRNYRVHHYVYRAPVDLNIYWSHEMYRSYVRMYPMVRTWDYPYGYRIEAIPAYDADHYRGGVMTVYGQINEAYYSRGTDEFFLYFGPYYPYQDFTVVLSGWMARQYSERPDLFFQNRNLAVTGLITTFEGDPEIVVKESYQLSLY
jgi:hypothetical protein